MLPICINLRQTIFKIHVKLLVQEIYSPSRGEDYRRLPGLQVSCLIHARRLYNTKPNPGLEYKSAGP